MASKTFLWIEDRKGKAGYIFWESLLRQLCPDIQVESKKNSSERVKSVKNINDEDDICGLDNSGLSVHDKMKSIYEGTSLKEQFRASGLEVAS